LLGWLACPQVSLFYGSASIFIVLFVAAWKFTANVVNPLWQWQWHRHYLVESGLRADADADQWSYEDEDELDAIANCRGLA
jgi:hypothetical protein